MRSAKAATGRTGRTVSGKRLLGVARNDFPSQGGRRTFPRRLSVCVEFHGGHDGRIAKAERPSAAPPNFSQLSARGCIAVGSLLYPIEKNRVLEPGSRPAVLRVSFELRSSEVGFRGCAPHAPATGRIDLRIGQPTGLTPIRRSAEQQRKPRPRNLPPMTPKTGAERGEARDGTTRRTRPWTARR